MTANRHIPVSVAEWSREALEIEAGARLLLVGDDEAGQGRELFRALHRRMTGRGLQVLNLGSLNGARSGSALIPLEAGKTRHDAVSIESQREQLLDSLRQGLDSFDRASGDPVVLFVEDIERADDRTKLLLEMLLDTGVKDYPFGDDPSLKAVVVAMDGSGPTAQTLARHPGTLRYAPGPMRIPESVGRKRLAVEVIRAVRYIQLAALPLKVNELDHLAGKDIITRLRKENIEVGRSTRGPGATVQIVDPRPAGLPDPATLPDAELRRYHERLLGVFEARRDDPGCAVARLRHAVGAVNVEQVGRLARPAIDALTKVHRFAEARELLVDSLDVLAGNREQITEIDRLRRSLGRIEASAGRPLDAAACVQSIGAKRRDIDDELLMSRSLLSAGRPHEAQAAILDWLGRSRTTAEGSARMRAVLAEVEYVRGNLDEAIGLCRELARSPELSVDDRARVANTHGKVYLARGSYSEAERIFKVNLDVAHAEGEPRHEVIARINAGIARMRQLHYASAKKLFVQARDQAASEGLYREEAIARENLATVHHMLRDYAEAMEHYRTAFALLRYLGNPEYLSRIANNLGEIYLRFGEVDRARSTRRYARDLGADYPVSQVEAEGMLLDGRVEMMQGDCGRAASAFDQAAKLFDGLGDRHHLAEALIFQAQANLELSYTDLAIALIDRASPLASDDDRMRARLELVRGCYERVTGGEAESLLVSALEALRESGDLEGELEALYALAEMELDRSDTVFARQHLVRAREINTVIRTRVPAKFHPSFDSSQVRRRLGTLEMRAATMERDRAGAARTSRHARQGQRTRTPYKKLIGQSEPMQVVFRAIKRVAPLDDLVLIEGESGTGKELVAEAIHALSERDDKPLIKINCASFVENLLQSELFGHERGAFTGAVRKRRGWFETASGGTLFLDEIGDISPATQVNLLRVLQDGVIHRVGGREPVQVDVRIIAATNRDLRQAVADGRFRKDLFYRLQGLRIVVPPLRERTDDLKKLTSHILDSICAEFRLPRRKVRLSQGASRLLTTLAWPGNVRELENAIRSAVLFADGGTVTQRELEPYIELTQADSLEPESPATAEPVATTDVSSADAVDLNQVLFGAVSLPQFKKEVEKRCIAAALRESKGNITRAASILGMKRPRLSQLVKYYGISKDSSGTEE